jgi:hypothetical protein
VVIKPILIAQIFAMVDCNSSNRMIKRAARRFFLVDGAIMSDMTNALYETPRRISGRVREKIDHAW